MKLLKRLYAGRDEALSKAGLDLDAASEKAIRKLLKPIIDGGYSLVDANNIIQINLTMAILTAQLDRGSLVVELRKGR